MTPLELARKLEQLADMYERDNEDPPVDYRATAEALRALTQAAKFVYTHGGNGDPPAEYRRMKKMIEELDRLLNGKHV